MLSLEQLRKKPHWSFSSINSLMNMCSMQWAFRKIYRLDPEHTPHQLTFGGAFHHAAEEMVKAFVKGEPLSEEKLAQCFSDNFIIALETEKNVLIPEKTSVDELILKGQQMLQCLADNWDPDTEVIGTSVPFSVDLVDSNGEACEKPLIGEFDLVIRDPKTKEVIIVDWKTSASKWPITKADKDLQATAYLMAYEQMHPGVKCSFRYDVVTKAKTPTYAQYPTTRETYDFLRFTELVKIADRIVAENLYYPNETSFSCSGCQYAKACKNSHLQHELLIKTVAAA